MDCSSCCMFCDQRTKYFINTSMYHGVCSSHSGVEHPVYTCSHCESIVPIIAQTCESCQNPSFLVEEISSKIICYSCADRSSLAFCSKCSKDSNVQTLGCGHVMCSDCLVSNSNYCPMCYPPFPCPSCGLTKLFKQDLSCGHSKCYDCFSLNQKCFECLKIFCSSCGQVKYNRSDIKCEHVVCEDCLGHNLRHCPECFPKFSCQKCNVYKFKKGVLDCNHEICVECLESNLNLCEICHPKFYCDKCAELKTDKHPLSCSHSVCFNCFQVNHNYCPVCFPKNSCEDCNQVFFSWPVIECHVVCPECLRKNNQNCPKCRPRFKCEKCHYQKYEKAHLNCVHSICGSCFEDNYCPLCSPKFLCGACDKHERHKASLSCIHSICISCSEKTPEICPICFPKITCKKCSNEEREMASLFCEHDICNACFKNNSSYCPLCSPSFVCLKCRKERNLKQSLSCKHDVCEKCFKKNQSQCPECHPGYICENCKKQNFYKKDLVCNHKVCHECQRFGSKPCPLCQYCDKCESSTHVKSLGCHNICENCMNEQGDCPMEINIIKVPEYINRKEEKQSKHNNIEIEEETDRPKSNYIKDDGYNNNDAERESLIDGKTKENLCELSCSCFFLVLLYIFTLCYCLGCIFNCCCSISTDSDVYGYCLCEINSHTKKIWRHLVSFSWAKKGKSKSKI